MLDNIPGALTSNVNNFINALSLRNETCCLKHGPEEMKIRAPKAVDFLCQCLGLKEENKTTELLRIPICSECVEGLFNSEWLLVYCVNCNSSQWIFKPESSIKTTEDMIWLDECPECKEV